MRFWQVFQKKSPLRTALMIGTLPLFFLCQLLNSSKPVLQRPEVLALAFAFTGCILWVGDRFKWPVAEKWRPLVVGMAQTIALFPVFQEVA